MRRQPLAARVWGTREYADPDSGLFITCYRWWWCDCPRHKKKAKRRSARRERAAGKKEINDTVDI
jgi:hypothetical protein